MRPYPHSKVTIITFTTRKFPTKYEIHDNTLVLYAATNVSSRLCLRNTYYWLCITTYIADWPGTAAITNRPT